MTSWIKIAYLKNYDFYNWGPIEKAYPTDACFDLRAALNEEFKLSSIFSVILRASFLYHYTIIPLGIKIEIPEGYCLKIFPRSGLGSKGITMTNNVGIIDCHYRGEIKVPIINLSHTDYVIKPGQKIVQAKLEKVEQTVLFTCAEGQLNTTERGEGGFGHSG